MISITEYMRDAYNKHNKDSANYEQFVQEIEQIQYEDDLYEYMDYLRENPAFIKLTVMERIYIRKQFDIRLNQLKTL